MQYFKFSLLYFYTRLCFFFQSHKNGFFYLIQVLLPSTFSCCFHNLFCSIRYNNTAAKACMSRWKEHIITKKRLQHISPEGVGGGGVPKGPPQMKKEGTLDGTNTCYSMQMKVSCQKDTIRKPYFYVSFTRYTIHIYFHSCIIYSIF